MGIHRAYKSRLKPLHPNNTNRRQAYARSLLECRRIAKNVACGVPLDRAIQGTGIHRKRGRELRALVMEIMAWVEHIQTTARYRMQSTA